MTTACIVQARLGSTRLPAKVLLPLPAGRTVLGEVLWRCKQIPGVDVVVCAMPDVPESDILIPFARVPGNVGPEIILTRGSEHDVLGRYAKAAEAVEADVIMRVTADCPLIDPEVCRRTLAMVDRVQGDRLVFAANNEPRTFPIGYDCEVFTRSLLAQADAAVPHKGDGADCLVTVIMDDGTEVIHHKEPDREHVGPWMRRNATDKHFIFGEPDRSHLRWTLDTVDDYVRIWGVMEQQMREAA